MKKCNHQFWKDGNPAGCLNCGKTKEEIYKENIIKAERERIIKKLRKKYNEPFSTLIEEVADVQSYKDGIDESINIINSKYEIQN